MDLQQFVGILAARWKFIVITVLIGTLATVMLGLSRSPEYASTGRVFIAVPNDTQLDSLSTLLVTQRASSYAALATDPVLLQKVVDRSGLPITRTELAERISASVATNTQIVEVTATGQTPEEARDLADAEIQELVALVTELERPANAKANAAVVARSTGTPTLDPEPIGLPMYFLLGVGIVLSILAGIAGALLKDLLDRTIKSRHDVESSSQAPVISALPLDRAVAKDARGAVAPTSSLIEAFRVLRTNLRFADLDGNRQVILVTSALPNEGKTLTAVNLAKAMAAAGQSVLLVDCDLRNPNAAASLGLETSVGVMSVLLGRVPLEGAIQPTADGLDVLPTGPRPPNPSEVLETDAVRDLINELRTRYDVIVLDAPPVLPVSDTSALVRYSDGIIVLARFGQTRKDALKLAVDRLTALGGRLYGSVLNGVPTRSMAGYGYGYYGYYGYGPEDLPVAADAGKRRAHQ